MSDEIERLLVRVEANAVQFENQMRKINKSLYGSQYATQQVLQKIKAETAAAAPRMFKPIGDSFKNEMASLAPVLAAAFSAKQVLQYADGWTSAGNKLAAAGVASSDLAERQERLVQVANDSRTGLQDTIALYSRLTIATQAMGASVGDTIRLSELLNKSFQSSGASTQEAASAALQLSQALASGVLQGDELRSLRENAPLLAKAIADAMGVSIGALKELGAEGKITSAVVMKAILAAGDSIDARFAATSVTVSQSLTILNNELGKFVGQTDTSLGATQRMAQGIILLAGNLDTILPILGTVATFFGTRYAGSLALAAAQATAAGVATARLTLFNIGMTASLTGATRAQVALNLAMAANPAGAVIAIIATLAAGLFFLASRYNSTAVAARELDKVVGAADTALGDYRKAVEAAKNASAEERAELDKKAASLRAVTLARINDAKVAAQRQIDEAVAARQRADAAIGASADARQRSFANPTNATAALAGGASGQARAAILLAQRQRAEADTAIQAVGRLKAAQDEIENPRRPTVTAAGGGDSGGKKSKEASGPTPEELAAQREMLRLQGSVELLKAQGRDADAAAIQRQIDILNLTKQFSDAGVANARQAATDQVNAIALGEAAARGREAAAERTQFFLDAANDALAFQNDQMRDRLGFEAELARLSGDPVAAQANERELWIEERINTLLTQRKGLITREGARQVAEGERSALDTATRQGESNDRARSMARDFVDVLSSDSWAEAAGRKFKEAAFDNLEDLLTTLFSSLSGNGGGAGGSLGTIIGSTLKAMIPGFAAGTASAPGGLSYVHKGEVLTNLKKGTSVIPAHAVRAMGAMAGRAQVQPMARAQTPVVRIYMDEGGLFAPRVQQISGPVAVQTTAAGVAYAQDQTQQASRRRRQSFV